jgi:type II secretory pathway pseudopilin PulG
MLRTDDDRPTTSSSMTHHLNDYRSHSAARRSERGYILLMLMLFVALLAIAAGALAPSIAFRVKRDREEEMIHRGVQYSRALRRFVKKTGRYPSRIEELENTNNIRFLRRRYKDPITGKDFKLLHVGEVQLASSPGIGIGVAASEMGAKAATAGGAAALLGAASSMMAGAAAQATPVMPQTPSADAGADASGDSGKNAGAGGDQSKPDSSQPGGGTAGSQLTSTVFGGGPIVGVASISKAKTVREFNHKNHYNDWQFIYDPTMDRGGLIMTPAQPALQVSAPPLQQNSSGSNNSSGSSSPFGGMQSAPPAQQPQAPPQ